MKTDEIMEECSIWDEIPGYSHYTNDRMKFKKTKDYYALEVPYTSRNPKYSHPKYILNTGVIPKKTFDPHEAVQNSINGICEIIIDGQSDKSLNEIFVSMLILKISE